MGWTRSGWMEDISPVCHPSMAQPEVDLERRVGMEGEGEV